MYAYSEIDQKILGQRVVQFRGQMERFLKGELAPAEFLPLRLQNGLYIQRHAPMLWQRSLLLQNPSLHLNHRPPLMQFQRRAIKLRPQWNAERSLQRSLLVFKQ